MNLNKFEKIILLILSFVVVIGGISLFFKLPVLEQEHILNQLILLLCTIVVAFILAYKSLDDEK